MDKETLKNALQAMIVEECDKDVAPDTINDSEQLIGGPLELDSLDALQISMAIESQYGVRIEGGPMARSAFQSIESLADFILVEKEKAD